MKNTRLFKLVPALILGLGFLALVLVVPPGGLAQQSGGEPDGGGSPAALAGQAPPASALAASGASDGPPVGSPLDISGSFVETDDCYQADKAQTLCFRIHNGSDDYWNTERISRTRLTFPTQSDAWSVTCNPALQDAADSTGAAVHFNCTMPYTNEVVYVAADSYGEINGGASWGTCVNVTVPPGYTGDRYVNWELTGTGNGGAPHAVTGTLKIEQCTPLRLTPAQLSIEGCNGTTQTLEFKLVNYAAGNAAVHFTYFAPDADFTGPDSVQLNEGDAFTFTAQLKPDMCLETGEHANASLTAEGNGQFDTALITHTVTGSEGWQRLDDSPIATMDNVVIWANHGDGGLWSVGGYESGGVAQRYDPATGAWITYTNPLTPLIEYPMDGCYGLNGDDHEVIVLFPDTVVTGELQIFDITTKQWYTETTPPGYPAKGRWAQDVVSMIQHIYQNVCYLSGGSTEPGGGRTRDLWVYTPTVNAASYIGPFTGTVPPYTTTPVFDFHASWYVPWVGDEGGICVAGGIDHNGYAYGSTQCYDLHTGQFNEPNADLGKLPEPWWGMADGWQVTAHGYELWIANGVAQDGTLLPASAYIREGMSNFAYGPAVPNELYRLEGSAWENQFYTLNGSRGSFWSSEFSLHLASCPTCHRVYLPLVLRNH